MLRLKRRGVWTEPAPADRGADVRAVYHRLISNDQLGVQATVSGVVFPHFGSDTEIGGEKGGPELRNQFFAGAAFISPFHAAHVAGEASFMFRPVRVMPISA